MSINSPSSILVFGAHPDDIEYGCGGVIAAETQAGRAAHFVVCSSGEAGSNGTADSRKQESTEAARILGASIEFLELDGDAHLEVRVSHAIKLAALFRRYKPFTVLVCSTVSNQHPDHARLGELVRDAARLARYGGLKELLELDLEVHSIDQLFYYAVTPDGEPADIMPIYIEVQGTAFDAWIKAMEAHQSQAATRNYIDLQLARAKLLGARAGVGYAIALYSNEPLIFTSLTNVGRGARSF
ncbi:bacillithiol biosynthesis deacetylase BshB1 [soil metagenome]